MVVLIIAILASIAAHRLNRHAGTSAANASKRDVMILQHAIERYRAEHGSYPADGNVADQLTKYTDLAGGTSDARVAPYVFGPYVRKIPPVPVGPARGNASIAAAAGLGVGWIYDASTGDIRANE